MPIRIRFQYDHGAKLGYSIERLRDGTFLDPASRQFAVNPTDPIAPLAEDSYPFVGRFKATIDPTPGSIFNDGDYVVSIHDAGHGDAVVAQLGATMFRGDDGSVLPSDRRITAMPKGPPESASRP